MRRKNRKGEKGKKEKCGRFHSDGRSVGIPSGKDSKLALLLIRMLRYIIDKIQNLGCYIYY